MRITDHWLRSRRAEDFYAWKGYSFDILNMLDDEDYIRQGSRPSRTKSVYITDADKTWARELLEKYGIEDWVREETSDRSRNHLGNGDIV